MKQDRLFAQRKTCSADADTDFESSGNIIQTERRCFPYSQLYECKVRHLLHPSAEQPKISQIFTS